LFYLGWLRHRGRPVSRSFPERGQIIEYVTFDTNSVWASRCVLKSARDDAVASAGDVVFITTIIITICKRDDRTRRPDLCRAEVVVAVQRKINVWIFGDGGPSSGSGPARLIRDRSSARYDFPRLQSVMI